jgi:hypothetical protein
MTQEAEAASEAGIATSPRKADVFGLALLATIGIVTMAWIGGLIWLAMVVLSWFAA